MLRYVIAAAGLAVALPAVPAGAAHARAGQLAGNGTVTPGLTTVCAEQVRTFSGTFTIEPSQYHTYAFTVDGASACATTAAENGNLVVNGDVAGNLTYARTGNVVTLTGRLDVDGHSHDVRCVVGEIPTTANPTTTYNWAGGCTFGV